MVLMRCRNESASFEDPCLDLETDDVSYALGNRALAKKIWTVSKYKALLLFRYRRFLPVNAPWMSAQKGDTLLSTWLEI